MIRSADSTWCEAQQLSVKTRARGIASHQSIITHRTFKALVLVLFKHKSTRSFTREKWYVQMCSLLEIKYTLR